MSENVTIIIPTRDRPRDLEITVQTVIRQTALPSELIIVDQSDSPESQSAVENTLLSAEPPSRSTIQLEYVRDTKISGGAVARNRAMAIAKGSIWLFLDDDVELEPDFIEQILNTYREH